MSIDSNDFINIRTFNRNAKETAVLIGKMVNYANEEGISSSLKHFPGYGNNVDTHTGIAIDERSYENFVENDYLNRIVPYNRLQFYPIHMQVYSEYYTLHYHLELKYLD